MLFAVVSEVDGLHWPIKWLVDDVVSDSER